MNEKPYYFIRAWGRMLKSSGSYIEGEVKRARQENASSTAIYRADEGWVIFETIVSNHTRDKVQKLAMDIEDMVEDYS